VVKGDLSYCALGARILLKYLGKFLKEAEGVRNHAFDDPEYVHRMRVATRRLRSAVPLFATCFSAGDVHDWEREIKRVTGALGKARDADVQLAVLRDVTEKLPDPGLEAGIRRLSLRVGQGRMIMQPKVVRTLDRFADSGAERNMMENLREILGRARIEKAPAVSASIFETAAEVGMEKMADAMSYDDFVRDPGNVEQLHALRKSAKKLRYTLEIFDAPYGKGLQPFIENIKKLQTLLGDIHDCDVWMESLPVFLEEERSRMMSYYGHTRPMSKIRRGVEYFEEERRTKRFALYGEFMKYWDGLWSGNFWENLGQTLESGSGLLEEEPEQNVL